MAKIAVVPVPLFSHAGATIRLTGVLARQGHEVIVWGPANCRHLVESLGAKLELHEPEMPGPRGHGHGHVADLIQTVEPLAAELIEQLFTLDADLVIHDSQTPWARIAGDYLGVPRITADPMFPPALEDWNPSRADPWSEELDSAQATAHFEACWQSIAHRWGVELDSGFDLIHSPAETKLAFTTERLIGSCRIGDYWRCVGPLLTPAPPSVARADRPLVYVCLGTAFNTRPELFKVVIMGLADQPLDVLIAAADGMVRRTELDRLPANVTVRSSVSVREALSRASVHITHGGCYSVHESLLAGVPMVCLPQGFAQSPLSRNIEILGAGIVTEEHPVEICDAVSFLLSSEKAAQRTSELRDHLADYDGERRVAEVIDGALSGRDQ